MRKEAELVVQGKSVKVSNLDKVLYPKAGFTKAQVIDYYVRISPWLLPHLKSRPLTLKRYPDGVEGLHFYEKRCPDFRPAYVETAALPSRTRKGQKIKYCLANNLPTLVWAANLADIEMHTLLAKCRQPEQPTMIVFDLDPGPPAQILHCAKVAIWLREIFDRFGLQCFPKTSGAKGLQVYVPLNTRVTFNQTKSLAKSLAETLERQHPAEVVSKMAKSLRAGKVFVDWSQNESFKTTVCVYSLRASEQPTVSTPVTWEELEKAHQRGQKEDLVFRCEEALKRAHEMGDIFAPVLTLKQKLPKQEPD